MREEIADLIYPVITHGLRLKEQLARGEHVPLQPEQAELKGLLMADVEAQRWPEYAGERPDSLPGRRAFDTFLGIRYALVCWLDEIFILDSPWEEEWADSAFEQEFYGSRERAYKFW